MKTKKQTTQTTRKHLSFDLDSKHKTGLRQYYPNEHYINAYYDIKKFLKKYGFAWVNGDGYYSNEKMTYLEVYYILDKLFEKYPWLHKCMRVCKITEIVNSSTFVTPQMANNMIPKSTENEVKEFKIYE